MKWIGYLKKNGVKHAWNVLYQYKIDIVINKICMFFLSKKQLKNLIMIESHNDFDCNGGAFYDYLIKEGYNRNYKIVWMLKHISPQKLPANVKTVPVFRPSIRKNYYLCVAKYILSDCNIPKKRRKDQISIYCTHGGVTFKNVQGMIVIPSTVDYVLSASTNYDKIACRNYAIASPEKRMLHIGYPHNDILFRADGGEMLKISKASYKKKILWMPTFRKGGGWKRNDSNVDLPLGIPIIESEEQLMQLNTYLKGSNILLVIKIHPMQDLDTIQKLKSQSNIIILDGNLMKSLHIDVYRLMASADALISDYSSAAYSFLLLDRPIGFVLSDIKDYKCGLIIDDIDIFLPGQKIYSYDDLISFIFSVEGETDNYGSLRRNLCSWLYQYQDGNSCKRLAEFMNLSLG